MLRRERMSKSDNEFLEELYIEMYDKLYRFAYLRLNKHHLAQEITQDVFVLAQEKIDRVRSSPNPQGWLVQALSNTIMHALRTKQIIISRNIPLNEELAGNMHKNECEYGLEDFLSEDEWELLNLIYCNGYSIQEASNQLGIEYEACRKRVYRARKKIKDNYKY
ncbi:MAG: sigma-70 family RNA polymerase sigma factor [Clostridia bacterium]|nr:sigma-70 family RNA polymerase sigma factor [Clostridia bacterium]